MFELTQRVGESLLLDGRITLTVVAIENGIVQIEIDAPPEIPVHENGVQYSYPFSMESNRPLDELISAGK